MASWSARIRVFDRLIGKRRRLTIGLFGLMLAAAAMESFGISLVLPIVYGLIGDGAQGTGKLAAYAALLTSHLPHGWELETLLVALIGIFFVKGAVLVLTNALSDYFALLLRDDWCASILDHYLAAPRDTIAHDKQGTIVHNVTVETYRAARGMTVLLDFANRSLMSVVLVAVLLTANYQTTLAVGALGALLFYAARRPTLRYSIKNGKLHIQLHQEVSAIVTEAIAGATEVKLYNAYRRIRAEVVERLRRHTIAETWFRAIKEVPVQSTDFLVVFLLGATLIVAKRVMGVDPGDYIAPLVFFLMLAQRLLVNVNFLIAGRMKIAAYLPSFDLVHDLLVQAPDPEPLTAGREFTGLDGDIELRGVRFGYVPGHDVFSGLNLVIPRGKTTALIGSSGAGKSTVADLLLALLTPQAGTIRYGSANIAEYNVASLRRHVGYVSQHPVIFNASVRDNIRFGRPDAPEADVVEAARIANADAFIRGLPQGYDTPIGDRGKSLSGGERQRVAIARAVLCRPDLYVFDEATSALDGASETLVRDAIPRLSGNATVLVIAHRASAVAKADVVYRIGADGARRVSLADPGVPLAGVAE